MAEMNCSILEQEIFEQPAALARLLESEREGIEKAARAIRAREPRFIMLAARGSSDNAARYGQYLFGARNRLPVALATPSLFTLYQQPPNLRDGLILGISQSGQSPDIVEVLAEGRRQGALTVGITNDPASRLAEVSDHVIRLHTGAEKSIAATKTYTASLLSLAMLSVALAEDEVRSQLLARLPQWASLAVERAQEIIQSAQTYREIESCAVIGRGYNYATAYEIALKLKELACVLAEPYSSADFQHGPVALVEQGFPVLAVVPEGAVERELIEFLRKLKERSARLLVISAREGALALADTPVSLPADIPEWLSPIVAVLPGQLFALGLTLAKGLDPDHPRGLQKITRTR